MKQQDANNQSGIIETLQAQNGQALEAAALNDLPINKAHEADVKGGIVALEYLLLSPISPQRPATAVTPRP